MSVYGILDSALTAPTLALGERFKTHLGRKLALALGLNAFALLPYYLLQHYPSFPVRIMPLTVVDEWIPFNDRAVWLYLSLFLLIPMSPMQMTGRDQLRRYTIGIISMSLLADVVFFLWPTTVTRPQIETTNMAYQHLTRLVSSNNACPSLHAAAAVFSALCYEQIARHSPASQLWRAGFWSWALGIVYSTLATKEHVMLDAISGSLLGLITYLWAFRFGSSAPQNFTKGRQTMGWKFGIYFFAMVAGYALLIPAISHGDEQEDRAALSKIRSLYEEVVKTDDLSKLMPYLANDMTAVTPTGEEVKSPQELQAYFKKVWGIIGTGGTYEVKTNLGRTVFYGDMAVSSGTTDESIRSAAGNNFKQLGFWTAVTRKIDGQWKVIRMHGSMDPLTNSFVTTFRAAELKITKLVYGLGGLGVGLLLGFGFHFLRRRATA